MIHPLRELFNAEGKTILIYLGKETITDPIEKTTEVTLMTPIAIKALVVDLIMSQIVWKIPGINTSKAKEIIIEKRDEKLIEHSHKIQVDGEFYVGWRDNAGANIQKRQEGEYVRILVYQE